MIFSISLIETPALAFGPGVLAALRAPRGAVFFETLERMTRTELLHAAFKKIGGGGEAAG